MINTPENEFALDKNYVAPLVEMCGWRFKTAEHITMKHSLKRCFLVLIVESGSWIYGSSQNNSLSIKG